MQSDASEDPSLPPTPPAPSRPRDLGAEAASWGLWQGCGPGGYVEPRGPSVPGRERAGRCGNVSRGAWSTPTPSPRAGTRPQVRRFLSLSPFSLYFETMSNSHKHCGKTVTRHSETPFVCHSLSRDVLCGMRAAQDRGRLSPCLLSPPLGPSLGPAWTA